MADETIVEQAQRLHTEAVGLMAGTISPSSNFNRQGRLIEIGKWFAKYGAGAEDVRALAPVAAYLRSERSYVGNTWATDWMFGASYPVKTGIFAETGRQAILDVMSQYPTKSWVSETQLYPALLNMLQSDKHLGSLTAAMQYLTATNIPASQVGLIVSALKTLKVELPGNAASASDRSAASHALDALYTQLQAAQAQIDATGPLPGQPPLLPGQATPGDPLSQEVHVQGKGPPFDWKPWAAVGGAVALLGAVWLAYRRRPVPALPAASVAP